MYRLQAILCKARRSGLWRQFPPKASWAVFGQLLIIMIKNVATQMLNTLMIDWTPGSVLPVQSFPGHVRWLCVSRSDCREHLAWWWWWWRFIQRVANLISIYRQLRDVLFPDPPLCRPELAPRQEQDVQEGVHQEHKRRCWCRRWKQMFSFKHCESDRRPLPHGFTQSWTHFLLTLFLLVNVLPLCCLHQIEKKIYIQWGAAWRKTSTAAFMTTFSWEAI